MNHKVYREKVKELAYEALKKNGPMLRREVSDQIAYDILKPYGVPDEVINVVSALDNLGFQLLKMKEKEKISNDSNCLDANEGLIAPAGTYFILKGDV